MKFDGKDFGLRRKIRIGSEDGPVSFNGHRANENVYREDRDALRPALITKLRGILVVRPVYGFIVKRAQVQPQLFVLLRSFHARKQFLPDQPDNRRSPFADQFLKLYFEPRNLLLASPEPTPPSFRTEQAYAFSLRFAPAKRSACVERNLSSLPRPAR